MGDLFLDGLHQVVVALDALPGKNGHLPVLHIAHVPGVLDDGSDVTGQEVAAVPVAQDQRTVLPDGHQPVRRVGAEDAQGVGPLDAAEHTAHSLQNVPLVEVLDELGHHLGVRLGGEGHPLGLQEGLQLGVVLDDAVVDHRDLAILTHLGVGVDVAGRPVGGPAGMADAHGAVQGRAPLKHVGQHLEPALGLVDGQGLRPLRVDGHTGGIIPPVLQSGQTVQQDGSRLLPADIANDSTHI